VYTLRVLLITFLGYAVIEGLVFHSGRYTRILNPDSSTGAFERFLLVERQRAFTDKNQVLGIGNSRMALQPRSANELSGETGYTFASVAVPGASPRAWYYMLRDVDPHADRYAAVIIGLDNYNDDESLEDLSDRTYDLRFIAARLRLSDLLDLPRSFDEWPNRWETVRTILLRGSAYSTDFQDFLLHPRARLEAADAARRQSSVWFYDYVGPSTTMENVHFDFQARTVEVPPERAAEKGLLEFTFFNPLPKDLGEQSRYMRRWLGKIEEHYQGSKTRLIFVRLPRGPVVRPDLPPTNLQASVRQLHGATLIDEHMFDDMETPVLFQDHLHLNQPGLTEFSHRMAREIRRILGPPR